MRKKEIKTLHLGVFSIFCGHFASHDNGMKNSVKEQATNVRLASKKVLRDNSLPKHIKKFSNVFASESTSVLGYFNFSI